MQADFYLSTYVNFYGLTMIRVLSCQTVAGSGGSRGGSGGSVEPPKVKHNTILFLVKKGVLNNNNN